MRLRIFPVSLACLWWLFAIEVIVFGGEVF
jgi:hypothetical protein